MIKCRQAPVKENFAGGIGARDPKAKERELRLVIFAMNLLLSATFGPFRYMTTSSGC
jgi:hypothetical protein